MTLLHALQAVAGESSEPAKAVAKIPSSPCASTDGGGVGRMDGESETLIAHALRAEGFDASEDGSGRGTPIVPILANGNEGANGAAIPWRVRRLMPVECERLQGFPDGYTAILYRGKPAADGSRYRALGNSMAVPVMAWIGRRIAMVDAL